MTKGRAELTSAADTEGWTEKQQVPVRLRSGQAIKTAKGRRLLGSMQEKPVMAIPCSPVPSTGRALDYALFPALS